VSTHEAVHRDDRLSIMPADQSKDVHFILLKDGRIYFHGHATELRASKDPYPRAFLSGWIPPLI
jgi:hypothetical protein